MVKTFLIDFQRYSRELSETLHVILFQIPKGQFVSKEIESLNNVESENTYSYCYFGKSSS